MDFDHEYYHSEGITDLEVIKKSARDYQDGDWYQGPSSSRIHMHPATERCVGKEHIEYTVTS